jgi:hypothetical protein
VKKWTNRTAWWLSALPVAALLLSLWWLARPPYTVEEVDDMIRTKLPLGSDKDAVARLVIAHGWYCSPCMAPSAPERKTTLFNEYHAPGLIYARTDAWHEWVFNYCYIDIIFLFGKRGKLTGYSVVKAIEGF